MSNPNLALLLIKLCHNVTKDLERLSRTFLKPCKVSLDNIYYVTPGIFNSAIYARKKV